MVRYFGESPKTTPPSVFFPVFVRFIRSYKVRWGWEGTHGGSVTLVLGWGLAPTATPSPWQDAEQENETRKKQEEVMREKLLAQEAKKQEKVSVGGHLGGLGGGTRRRHLCPQPGTPASPSQRNKWQQQELIAELRRRQAKDHRPVYEGKDGTIEDIITGTAPAAPPDPDTWVSPACGG